MTNFMFDDRVEKFLVWLCAVLFCVLFWVQVIKYIQLQLRHKDELRQEIQKIRNELEESSKITVDGKEIRYASE